MKKFFSDFKKFITKGNIVDLAIAVVIGGAFGKIVTSMVNDIIMPLIGLASGGVNVAELKWVVSEAVYNGATLVSAEVAVRYGAFLQAVIDFLIIAFFIFIALRILVAAKNRFDEVKDSVKELSKKQIKKLKKSGLTDEQISNLSNEQQAPEKVEVVKQQTTEDLLKEIRDLLKAKTEHSGKDK